MLVVVEGIEGSGKSTLASGLAARLRADGWEVVETREPGGTPLGDAVRALFLDAGSAIEPAAELLLVNAARAQHVERIIRPALAAGKVVVCDRFTDSTLAYQGYGRGMDVEIVRIACDIATKGVRPAAVLLLDVPVSAGRERLRSRTGAADRIESEDDAFHERVRRGYLTLAAAGGHRVFDGMKTPAAVLEEALAFVRGALRERPA